ncbi:MAG: LacI family transcriptional regulator [Hungatella sp.]|jgi:LacI family transcriptional regulator|nr:LacI family transcriptional regulator [Hungatella sp.]
MKKTYNLKDVAKLAQVSLGTASKVLNHIYVKPDLQARVEAAVKELNYTPNEIARSLKVNSTNTVGIMIPDISSPVISKVVKGIEDFNRQEGYNGIIYQTALEMKIEEQAIETFVRNKVDGILYIGNTVGEEIADRLKKSRIPVVFIMTNYEDPAFSSVTIDNVEAAYSAVDYLCRKGHKQILMLAGEKEDPNAGVPRLRGYLEALKKHGIEPDPSLIRHGGYRLKRGYEDMSRFLLEGKKISALFAVSDEVAIGAVKALFEHQIRVPEDVSVFGFDGIEMIHYSEPTISSISQPFYELGSEAAKILMCCMKEGKGNVHKVLPFQLVENKSVTDRR